MKVHYVLVLGNCDLEANNISARIHAEGPRGATLRAEVTAGLLATVKERRP